MILGGQVIAEGDTHRIYLTEFEACENARRHGAVIAEGPRRYRRYAALTWLAGQR